MTVRKLTAAEVETIRARAAKASETRWIAGVVRKDGTVQVYSPSRGPCRTIVPIAETTARDAAFIAACRADVPALCDTVDALLARVAKLEAAIERVTTEHGFVVGPVSKQILRDALADACRLPPEGWRCTRAGGHEGPCAALADAEPERQEPTKRCPNCDGERIAEGFKDSAGRCRDCKGTGKVPA